MSIANRLPELLAGIPKQGVVHIGAHLGQETGLYRELGFPLIRLVEPNPACHPKLRELRRLEGVEVVTTAAGVPGQATLHVTSASQRSSLLPPTDYEVTDLTTVETVPLHKLQTGCNVAVLDTQGTELEVLRTGDLGLLDLIVVEATVPPRYRGAASRQELIDYLTRRGWLLAYETDAGHTAGITDQVWVKKQPATVILQCAGEASRWGDFHGVPKHLVTILGEPILHRTVRLLNEIDPDIQVLIGVKDHLDPLYKITGSSRRKARIDTSRYQADKILSSEHLWATKGRTVLLYGDIFWTEPALRRVVGSRQPWAAAARFTGSNLTGCQHAELFGFTFTAEENQRISNAANLCVELANKGSLTGWSGGWQVYKAAAAAPHGHIVGVKHQGYNTRDLGNSIEIDDWTDDFDKPQDWHNWCYQWATKGKPVL